MPRAQLPRTKHGTVNKIIGQFPKKLRVLSLIFHSLQDAVV